MRYLTWLILLLLLPLDVCGQVNLSGKITDKDKGTALGYVMIILKNKAGGSVLGFTQSATDGTFRLVTTLETVQKSSLHFTLMGYKEQICKLTKNGNQEFFISMEMSAVQIKEVIIKSRKIGQQGDTLTYNVASFANEQDRTIGDVLKKLPGIDVKKDGQIYYNGKSINKFYIEGRDLLEGRYGIATNGVPQKEVRAIEVMENHQPIKALQGFTYSDQAAVNLKLKDRSKARWIMTLDGGGGLSAAPERGLWEARFFSMMFKANVQNITTVKSNNTGDNIMSEIRDYSSSTMPEEEELIALGTNQAYDLEEERTKFNRSHLISSSSLWNLGKETALKTQLHYGYDRESSHSFLATTYYLPNDTKIIEEDEDALMHSQQLSGVVSIEANTDKSYLKNLLKANLRWNNVDVATKGTYPNTQNARLPVYRINNSLQWVKRLKKDAITFNSINEFYSKPQKLFVERAGGQCYQELSQRTFYTLESASYAWALGCYALSMKGGIEAYYRDFNSALTDVPDSLGLSINNQHIGYVRLYGGPELEYNWGKWKARLSVPVSYYYYGFSSGRVSENDLLAAPALSLSWKYSSKLSFHLGGGWSMEPYAIQKRYNGLIMRNYRVLSRGTSEYATGRQGLFTGGFDYKNPVDGFFASINVFQLWNKEPFRDVQQFAEDYYINSSELYKTHSNSHSVIGNISCIVDWIRGTVGVDLLYSNTASALVSEKQETPYNTTLWNLGINANGQILSWINWNYELKYGLLGLDIENEEKNSLHSWEHQLKCNISPLKKWTFQLSGEYYRNEIVTDTFRDILLCDGKVTFNSSPRLDFFVRMNNLFNKKEYSYAIYNSLSTIRRSHEIRGRELLIGFTWR